ncbi:hypothetical protein V6N13_049130 [Hibiscus sabdariffa]|uniref:Uncharacterized protein n=1 Tax=Hibiscus sabdariffa TaxID=183260 RepID=A0ABR2QY43_9ROSI
MASSYTSSPDSHPQNAFSFSTHPFMTNSFFDLLTSSTSDDFNPSSSVVDDVKRGVGLSLSDRIAKRTGSGVPKFKSSSSFTAYLFSSGVSFFLLCYPPRTQPCRALGFSCFVERFEREYLCITN